MALIADMLPKINSRLKSKRIRFRGIEELSDDRINVKAEVQKGTADSKVLMATLRPLGFVKVNGVYGRWVFKKTN